LSGLVAESPSFCRFCSGRTGIVTGYVAFRLLYGELFEPSGDHITVEQIQLHHVAPPASLPTGPRRGAQPKWQQACQCQRPTTHQRSALPVHSFAAVSDLSVFAGQTRCGDSSGQAHITAIVILPTGRFGPARGKTCCCGRIEPRASKSQQEWLSVDCRVAFSWRKRRSVVAALTDCSACCPQSP